MVPAIRMDGGGPVISMSRRRMARTSPMRAEVPSIASTMAPSCPSGFWAGWRAAGLPVGDGDPDGVHLGGGERVRSVGSAVQAGDVVHRVSRQHLVPYREPESE